MLLTRIWAIILALLATSCLAGMFLLSLGSGGDFSEADKAAIRSVTEAGVAALEAEIHSSKAQQARGLLSDERLQEALDRTPEEEEDLPPEALPRDQIVAEVAEDLRVRTESDVTLAIVDQASEVQSANGIAEPALRDLVSTEMFRNLPTDDEATFSVLLGGELNVAYVSASDSGGRRLVAVEPLNTGASSLLRRVLGSQNPAGLVRGKEIVGDILGDQPVTTEIESLADQHRDDTPESGASKVFVVGDGLDARIGALGRVPGPAGKGKDAVLFAVLSRETAAAGQKDLAEALGQARDKTGQLNWPLLGGLFLVSAALAIYLPQIEALGPMHRLSSEFTAVARGAQHQIFHDRYSGAAGEVARAAANAHEALRRAYLAELEIDDDGDEESATAPRARPRTGSRPRRPTRSHRKVEQPTAPPRAKSRPAVSQSETPATETPEPRPTEESKPTPAEPAPTAAAAAAAPSVAPSPAAAASPASPTESPRPSPASPAAPSAEPTSQEMPPPGATVAVPSLDDPKEAHFRGVFEEFLQVKEACGEATNGFSYEKFAAKLRKNRDDLIKKRPGIKDVDFTVYVKDGKAALKAKVIKA